MLLNTRVSGEVACQLTAEVKSERCRPAGRPPEGGETIGPTRTNTVGRVFSPRHTGISSCRKNTPSEGPKLAWGCADPNFSAGRRPTSESQAESDARRLTRRRVRFGVNRALNSPISHWHP